MSDLIATCRYCHLNIYLSAERVIYGVRHSAHVDCYVARHGWARLLSIATPYSAYRAARYAAGRVLTGIEFPLVVPRAL